MRETIALEDARVSMDLPDATRAAMAETAAACRARSLIVWGEHCSECAAPACYTACSFYAPRADGHCRRFRHGLEEVQTSASDTIALTRIVFRKWGKLEGRGPVRPFPWVEAHAIEQSQKPAHGWGLAPLARRAAWQMTQADRARVAGSMDGLDAFVLEGCTPHAAETAFTLTIVPADKAKAALYQTRLVLTPDWTRHVIALADIAAHIALDEDFLIQFEPIGEAEGIECLLGLADFVGFTPDAPLRDQSAPKAPASAAVPAAKAKVVVWDLDHTIWDGILLEDGAEGVTLRPGVRDVIQALDARGILQSVASKNNSDEALAALEHHGLRDLMLAPQIGWGPKSAAMTRLAHILNLGLDSFVFIDDQPFERGEVGEAHPAITVLPETCIADLLERSQFDVPVTPESRGRRALYQTEAARAVAADAAGQDYDGFLRSCDLKLTITRLNEADIERVYELSQRTNQLNVAATRYTREDVMALASGGPGAGTAHEAWTLRCVDRFGDYGLIGFASVDPAAGQIVDFFMSCRVQRKRVEAAFFNWLAQRLHAAGVPVMSARYRQAARNRPAVDMFEALGFALSLTSPEAGTLALALPKLFDGSDIVTIQVIDVPVAETV